MTPTLLSTFAVACALIGSTCAGCGSRSIPDDAGISKGLARFAGTWSPTLGSFTLVCAGKTSTDTITSDTIWSTGTSSDLVQTDGNCTTKANVTGNVATGLPSQSCTQMAGTATVTLTISAYTFSLNTDGTTATENASGTAAVTASGTVVNCTYVETATYQKLAT